MEDDAAVRALARTALTGAGFVVDSAENGALALSLATANPPDLIVLDSQLPVLDGVGFARSYRRSTPSAAPIIAVTGVHNPSLFAALVGAAAYLSKPFSPTDLVATARRVLGAMP